MKKNLCQTNPFLRDSLKREAMIARNAYESSVFEGAKGLKKPDGYATNKASRMASRKKSDRAE